MKKPSCRSAGGAFAQGAAVYGRIRQEESDLRQALLLLEERPDGQGQGRASRALSGRRCPVHAQYPLLVAEAFPFMEREKLLELCRLGRLYAEHLLAFDRALDRGERANPLDLLVSSLQQAESLLALYRWFSPGHAFWEDFWERASRTWRAVLLERIRHGHCLAPYPWEEYETTARNKGALLAIFALAPTYLSGDGGLRQRLSQSLDEHHKGLVLLDDLRDWREDYTRGQYSYPLTRVLLDNGFEDLVRRGPRPPLATVGRLLYGAGAAEEQLSLAEACFQRAVQVLEPLALPDWTALNHRYGALCASLRDRVGLFQTGQGRRRRDSEAGRAEGCGRDKETGREGWPAVVVQEGIPETSVQAARKGLQACRPLLRKPDALCLTLGRWDGMPSHFHLLDRGRVWVGVQACASKEGAEATSGRPLETETVLACVRAQRILCLGRERTMIETCFVAGLALGACLELRSLREPWRHLAMGNLEWQWCQKNEWVLWEMLQRHEGSERARTSAEGLADPYPEFGPPAPRGAVLYLSLRLFEEASANAVVAHPLWMLERWKLWEIRSALGLPGARAGGGDE